MKLGALMIVFVVALSQAELTGDLASLSDLPSALSPGEAIYVHSNEPTDLGAPAREERLRYYHQDHLGSSSVVTDADGALVAETAFYPFGLARHEHRLHPVPGQGRLSEFRSGNGSKYDAMFF